MASRYLLIEFDDASTADKLRQQIDAATRGGKRYRVVGLFAKPTNYCQCDPVKAVTTKANESPRKRGKKFGWWVCTQCRSPASTLAGLVNLLKPRDIIDPPTWEGPDTFKGVQHWTHHINSLSGLVIGEAGRTYWNEH